MSTTHSNDKTYLLNLIAGTGGLPSLTKVDTVVGNFASIIVDEDGTVFTEIKIDDAVVDLAAIGLDNALNKGAFLPAGAGQVITSVTTSVGQAFLYPKPKLD